MRRSQTPRFGGAIAAGHPETTRVGAEMLAAGGNAVDACVAAGIASWIAEPTVAGPGRRRLHARARSAARQHGGLRLLHGRARARRLAAARSRRSRSCVSSSARRPQLFLVGPGSCAVPGVAVGVHEAHRRAGRLPFAQLVEPAIRLARSGALLNEGQADLHAILDPLLRQRPAASEVFGPEGRMLVEGDSVRNLRLATTLERYAERGGDEFATGAHRACDRRGPGRRGRPGHRARPARVPRDRAPARARSASAIRAC